MVWNSRRQRLVALSTPEAEYIALCETAKAISWARQLLGEVGFTQTEPTVVYEDNQSCIHIAQNQPASETHRSQISLCPGKCPEEDDCTQVPANKRSIGGHPYKSFGTGYLRTIAEPIFVPSVTFEGECKDRRKFSARTCRTRQFD